MKKNMKFVSFIGYGLLAISVIIIIAFLATGDFTANTYPLIDLLLYWTYGVLGLAAVTAILLPLLNILKNPKAMIRSMLGMGLVVVVLLLCYLMADDTPLNAPTGLIEDKTQLVVSDTGLFATYIALCLSILAVIAGEISNVFKK